MYLPRKYQINDRETVFGIIESHPLGAWVCPSNEGLIANHLPFYLDRTRGPQGTLMAHVARANSAWRQLVPDATSVVIFQGPQAYVTPAWYPDRDEVGNRVPTWNYQVAHVHGSARAIEDPAWLWVMLERLTHAQESRRSHPWHLKEAPACFIDQLLLEVVGIEIAIDRLEGKLKASQDETMPDRHGTVQGLLAQPEEQARAMAALVLGAMPSDASPSEA